ncbi:MAG TPA: SDR family oxidoreductase [Gemmatimonadaceae bacterium]|jgi:long-chain acyl-CoA synthetase|nr:SDR family oxidoreductase [Gemmatimonadaceae bacterium]
MHQHRPTVLVTGGTGLIGRAVIARMLRQDPAVHVAALVRRPARWHSLAATLGPLAARVVPIRGDITCDGLALGTGAQRWLRRRACTVIHLAADTTFTRTSEESRATNIDGTRHVLETANTWPGVEQLVHVSTAFVAGELNGLVAERDNGAGAGFVNPYEWSKYEAERLVRDSALPWVIVRPSTVACDTKAGGVTQLNALHFALRLCYQGLAALMPGAEDTPMDTVTTRYVARAIAAVAQRDDLAGQTLHLCAGMRSLPLGELLDRTFHIWATDDAWKRRGHVRPALSDLETYRLFASTVDELGDPVLTRVTHALAHFIPQLAFPKWFDTSRADETLGFRAPAVAEYWPRMVAHLVSRGWDHPCRLVA